MAILICWEKNNLYPWKMDGFRAPVRVLPYGHHQHVHFYAVLPPSWVMPPRHSLALLCRFHPNSISTESWQGAKIAGDFEEERVCCYFTCSREGGLTIADLVASLGLASPSRDLRLSYINPQEKIEILLENLWVQLPPLSPSMVRS